MMGNTIQELRKKKGFSLSELSERSRISKSYLSNIERNININPSIDVLRKIAAVLDVDLKSLIGSNDEVQEKIEQEWVDFINELKESGIEKQEINEYKTLIEFIKWKNSKVKEV